ncbi:MAG: GAF domain-containing sensor histidine kinase [Ignavibacteriaceae bacterium]|nr:GAF domain-containing sensor histidine kinase [Ignavibacteriaceae bacterium]
MTNLNNLQFVEEPDVRVIENHSQAFYKYDYRKEMFQFITPTVEKLLGYNIDELNKIGFQSLVRNQLVDRKSSYTINHNSNSMHIEENLVTYLVETHNGENKWIEDNSFIICDEFNHGISRFGILKDVGAYMRDEKLRQIISEILEASNSEKNLGDLFKFIHTCIKKLMKADNFYIAYYKRDSALLTFPYFVDEEDTDSSAKKLGKGLTEYVLRTGASALVDLEMDTELKRKGEIELVGPQSPIWLGVPLKILDKTIGVMVVQDYSNPNTYGTAEQQILDVISYPISRAIERKMMDEDREEMIIQLKEMNRSKDRLFSLISHDLRAPFNSLLGFTEILTTEFDTLTHRDIKEYINVINDSSRTLYAMTNNLLHYSRLQLNKFDFLPEKISLDELINSAIDLLKFKIRKKDILIKAEVNKEYRIVGDSEMMRITFENLISNSVKYSKRGNVVKVFAEKITSESGDASAIQISITDEGVGLSDENQKKILNGEMFSTPGTDKEPGSGLGLLLAQKYISMNRGKFEMISKEAEGTTVLITFPILKSDY